MNIEINTTIYGYEAILFSQSGNSRIVYSISYFMSKDDLIDFIKLNIH